MTDIEPDGISHAVDVTAATLYEAAVFAVVELRRAGLFGGPHSERRAMLYRQLYENRRCRHYEVCRSHLFKRLHQCSDIPELERERLALALVTRDVGRVIGHNHAVVADFLVHA